MLTGFNATKGGVLAFVTGFEEVVSFQYSLNYNPNVLFFSSIDNTGSPLIGDVDGNFTPEAQDSGNLGLLWTNLNGEGQTLPADTPIFKLFFDVIGDPNECSQFDIYSGFIDLEIAFELPNGDFCTELEQVNFELTGGELCIECNDLFLDLVGCGSTTNSGVIQFSACGGTAPYSYQVFGPSGYDDSGTLLNGSEVVSLTGLETGLYTIDLVDADGTIFPIQDIELFSGPDLTVELAILDDVVCVGSDGDLLAVGDGGTPPYIYAWSNGLFTDTVEDVPEGTYEVTISDANGCEAVSMPITLQAEPLMIDVETNNATCDGAGDGSYIITVTGGEPINGDTYIFNQQPLTQGIYIDQNPGTYNIQVSDANGCNELVVVEVGIDGFVGTYDILFVEEIECFGDEAIVEMIADVEYGPTNGEFATFIGPDGQPVGYGSGAFPTTGNFRFAPITLPGMYTGFFFTPAGCRVEVEFDVLGPPEIVIEIEPIDVGCSGGDIDIVAEISGGIGSLTPMWSTGEGGLSISVSDAGTYTLTVTDDNMCTNFVDVDIVLGGSLGLTAEVVAGVGCGAAADSGSAEAMISGTATNVIYQWLDDAGIEVGDEALVTGLSVGTYTVIATDVDQDCSAEEMVIILLPSLKILVALVAMMEKY